MKAGPNCPKCGDARIGPRVDGMVHDVECFACGHTWRDKLKRMFPRPNADPESDHNGIDDFTNSVKAKMAEIDAYEKAAADSNQVMADILAVAGVNPAPESDHNGPVGQLAASVSGDEDGPIIGWSFNVGDGRIVYAGEISNARFAELDEDAQAAFGGKPFGWFLICYWPDRSEVWAKCAGDDESRRLVTLIGSMFYAGHLWRQEDHAGARQLVEHATAKG